MKKYDFDTPVNRFGTDCMKWDSMGLFYEGRTDLIPMWVADMDLRCCDELVEALTNRAAHGIYGYGFKQSDYYESIMGWYRRRHDLELQKDWILYIPNVVTGLRIAIAQFSQPGERVAILTPVYGPFRKAVEGLGRTLVTCPLVRGEHGRYTIDFDALDKALENTKVLLFCSPHNPVGRVWTEEELRRVSELCSRHGTLLVSDEIHCDLVQKPAKFTPMLKLGEETAANCITFISVSKTFNCAGLMGATAIIPNREIKARFGKTIVDYNLYMTNVFTVTGVKAAYTYGDSWVDQVIEYVGGNYRYVTDFLRANLPEVEPSPLEGSYLMWLDCRKLVRDNEDLITLMEKEAGIAGESGEQFGSEGEGFYRLNLATSRCVLEKAMANLLEAVNRRRA